MEVRLLIDQIMRQTTVLIAQLSTTAGVRAPIAHIADQVFLELSSEIERQGVSRKVAADMFGLALRSYQRRVQRVTESVSVRDRTLWEGVLDYLAADGARTRKEVMHRFRWDGEETVAAVLNDLANSGLVYKTGRGERSIYGITPDADLERLAAGEGDQSLADLLWVYIYRAGRASSSGLASQLRVDPTRVQVALDELVSSGRLNPPDSDGNYSSAQCLIPVGASSGWEAAVFDHFQAAAKAIANKLRSIGAESRVTDRIGGATLSFDISEDHPDAQAVFGLLAKVRSDANEIWERVVALQETHPIDESKKIKVTFYFGQNVEYPHDEVLHDGDSLGESAGAPVEGEKQS